MRICVWLATLLTLCVLAGAARAAARCTDGDVRACKKTDGQAGLQACVDGVWGSCNGAGGGGTNSTQPPNYQPADCLPESERKLTKITRGHGDTAENLQKLVRSQENQLILLADDVTISFDGIKPFRVDAETIDDVLLKFNKCVTLAGFGAANPASNGVARRGGAAAPAPATAETPPAFDPPLYTSARTPMHSGPVLNYGRRDGTPPMIGIRCSGGWNADGARINGVQLVGPDPNDHHSGEDGIIVEGCHDVDVSNIEAQGWGGAAIEVKDLQGDVRRLPSLAPAQVLLRIHDNFIHNNQNSSHTEHWWEGLFGIGHSTGYGVSVSNGAFVEIYRNLFDFNKHSITAAGNAGGYHATDNLLLKGGGFQNSSLWGIFDLERDIHIVDVHGSRTCLPWTDIPFDGVSGLGLGILVGILVAIVIGLLGVSAWVALLIALGLAAGGGITGLLWAAYGTSATCGDAGFSFTIDHNAFQYNKTTDIKIRGTPVGWKADPTTISSNVFAPDNKDAAIDLQDSAAVDVRPDNMYGTDTFGHYGVCDVDGDGVDDLVLMTGVTWWYSAQGVRPWWFLRRENRIPQDTNYGDFRVAGLVRLGDFDGDGKCDAVTDAGGGVWLISRGLVRNWEPFGNYLAPLAEVQFGRFDPNNASPLPGGRRPITHVFWRGAGGFWLVTPLGQPHAWTLVGSSSFPLSDLRFGDFTGDSVTDVLAIEQGHWSISDSARSQWQPLNSNMNDPVKGSNIFIGNMDSEDNIDDIVRLDQDTSGGPSTNTMKTLTWQRSQNGTGAWQQWRAPYQFQYEKGNSDYVEPSFGFIGRFSSEPVGVTLVIDHNRQPHFFSRGRPRETSREWTSDFHY